MTSSRVGVARAGSAVGAERSDTVAEPLEGSAQGRRTSGLRSSRSTSRRAGRRTSGLGSGPSTSGRAFTLVEVLAALLMMAIIIPVAMQGMSVASRAGILGQRKAAAMRVAERLLNETVIDTQVQQSSSSGTVSDGDFSYAWSMKTEAWPEDPMSILTVTVTFAVQGDSYEVNASTLIPQPGTSPTVSP